MVKKEATEVLEKDFNRRKNKNVLVKTRLRIFLHRIFRQDKYDESDFESDASIHYDEGHRIDYHENDKPVANKQENKNN